MSANNPKKEYRRTGQTQKCPACGVSVDADAYRCPKCMIYFCFKCRRRVQKHDQQFQCMNQQCNYYGKLLCNACVVEIDDTMTQVPPNNMLMLVGMGAAAVGVVSLWWVTIPIALGIGAGTFVAGAAGAGKACMLKENPPETVVIGRRWGCIACKQAVEYLR